jgi:hypothetical protein
MAISAVWDLPSGSTVVATFGAALLVSIPAGRIVRRAGRTVTKLEPVTALRY